MSDVETYSPGALSVLRIRPLGFKYTRAYRRTAYGFVSAAMSRAPVLVRIYKCFRSASFYHNIYSCGYVFFTARRQFYILLYTYWTSRVQRVYYSASEMEI